MDSLLNILADREIYPLIFVGDNMSSNGFLVVLTPEGLKRTDVQTYATHWGWEVNHNDQKQIINNFLNAIQQELITIVNS